MKRPGKRAYCPGCGLKFKQTSHSVAAGSFTDLSSQFVKSIPCPNCQRTVALRSYSSNCPYCHEDIPGNDTNTALSSSNYDDDDSDDMDLEAERNAERRIAEIERQRVATEAAEKARPVAEWMVREFRRDGVLGQRYAAHQILKLFGEPFVYRNDNGNWAIDKEVRKQFQALTDKNAVWDEDAFLWRRRGIGDSEGRAC